MQQITSWTCGSHSAGKQIPRFSWNLEYSLPDWQTLTHYYTLQPVYCAHLCVDISEAA